MIVIAIVSLVLSMGLPAITRVTYTRLNSTTRKFVGLIRTIRNDSILLSSVYRLAVDFEHATYWVESQKRFELLSQEVAPPPKKKGAKREEEPSNFAFVDKYGKKPTPMPQGIVIEGVLKEREGLRKDGIAYVYFFPNGFNDQAILYLNKEGNKEPGYSLLIRPTSGRVDILRERKIDFD